MNRRNFLKALVGGSIGVALASILPDSIIAKQVSNRHADILVDADRRCHMTIGDTEIPLDSLTLTIRHAPLPDVKELGKYPVGYDPTPSTRITIEHLSSGNLT